MRWLNRLSDLFFVLARFVNQEQFAAEKNPAQEAQRISCTSKP
jgi:cob(I)alamin adenosyltransferase